MLLGPDDVDRAVVEQFAELIENRQFAAAAEPRIDRQHPPAMHGRLQQQIPQIANEHVHRMVLGLVGQFAAEFAFQVGNDQPRQCVADALLEESGMRMIGLDQQLQRFPLERRLVGLDPHPQHLRAFTAIHRQQPMRRNLRQRLFEVVVILVEALDQLLPLFLLGVASRRSRLLASGQLQRRDRGRSQPLRRHGRRHGGRPRFVGRIVVRFVGRINIRGFGVRGIRGLCGLRPITG